MYDVIYCGVHDAVRLEDQQIRSLGLMRTPDLKSRSNHRVDPLIRQLRSASPYYQPLR